jgi:hypothetical protein
MFLGDFADNRIGDSGAFAQSSQMQLGHFSTAAHIVHQVESIPFSADKSHDFTSTRAFRCSVFSFHYTRQH